MKIHFLGTSHGYGEKGRFTTSMILETNGKYYIIDLGAPLATLMKNRNMDFSNVKAAFVTHMHSDHAIDIPDYIALCNWYDQTKYLYLSEGKEAAIAWYYALNGKPFDKGRCIIETVQSGRFYEDENITVTAIPTKHLNQGEIKTYAYIIEAENKRVLFTGDLSWEFTDFPKLDKHCDAIVCELTHYNVIKAIDVFNETDTEKIIFNHVYEEKAVALNGADNVKFSYNIVNDGDVITV